VPVVVIFSFSLVRLLEIHHDARCRQRPTLLTSFLVCNFLRFPFIEQELRQLSNLIFRVLFPFETAPLYVLVAFGLDARSHAASSTSGIDDSPLFLSSPPRRFAISAVSLISMRALLSPSPAASAVVRCPILVDDRLLSSQDFAISWDSQAFCPLLASDPLSLSFMSHDGRLESSLLDDILLLFPPPG